MIIVSIEIAIALECNFVTETDIPKEIWVLLQRINVKIELSVYNQFL